MSYVKTQWVNGDTITADKLNHIEAGIEANETENSLLKSHLGANTRNLFDPSYLVKNSNGTITEANHIYTGTASAFNSNFYSSGKFYPMPAFDANTAYTIQAVAKTSGADGTSGNGLQFVIRYTDGTTSVIAFSNASADWIKKVFTTDSSKTINNIGIAYSSIGTNVWNIKDIQVEKGTTATEFIPYLVAYDAEAREEIATLANTVQADFQQISGATANLFDPSYFIKNSSGDITEVDGVFVGTASAFNTWFSSNNRFYPMPSFEEGTQYTISIKAKNNGADTTGNGLQFNFHYTDGSIGVAAIANSQTEYGGFSTGSGSFTTAIGKTISKLCITYGTYAARNNVWSITDIQVEKGATATDYAPTISAVDYLTRNAIKNSDHVKVDVQNARHINNGSPLTLLHFSDLHGDTGALQRIMKYADSNADLIDGAICTGDMVFNTAEQITAWWDESVMTCVGNHDTASYTSGSGYNWTDLSMANRDAYYIAPFESGWGIIHTVGTSYYYKDYNTQNVRLIVMDVMLYTGTPGADATAQTAWLANLLADAITNNLHVLIAIHSPHGGSTAKNCSFSKYNQGEMPTNTDCNTPDEIISAVATAINNGLHFIGYICGHTHQDNMWMATNDGKQLMYCITCAVVANANQWMISDQFRDTKLDAYNLVTIDTTNTLMKIVRGGGADIDDHMRTRKAICFNYSTGEVVGEVL